MSHQKQSNNDSKYQYEAGSRLWLPVELIESKQYDTKTKQKISSRPERKKVWTVVRQTLSVLSSIIMALVTVALLIQAERQSNIADNQATIANLATIAATRSAAAQ